MYCEQRESGTGVIHHQLTDMYVYTYTVLETRMSGYHLLFVFYLEVLAVASCQGGSGTTAR